VEIEPILTAMLDNDHEPYRNPSARKIVEHIAKAMAVSQ
jgi:hypothetical protein